MVRQSAGAVALGLVMTLGSSAARGQCEAAKVLANDGVAGDRFGTSCAIDGDFAVVGSPTAEPTPPAGTGSAYVLQHGLTGWTLATKLIPTDAMAGDAAGLSVAISGDRIVVGSRKAAVASPTGPQSAAGAAYVFRFDGTSWVEESKLVATPPSDVHSNDEFGTAVAIDGDLIVVGRPKSDETPGTLGTGDSGSAFVYRYDGTAWDKEAKLLATDADGGDQFGKTVAVSGDWIMVGALGDRISTVTGGSVGSVYVYNRQGSAWVFIERLNASDAASGRLFGVSLSLRGDVAAMGDYSQNANSVYIFRRNGTDWTQEANFRGGDTVTGTNGDRFGVSVGIDGDLLVVGAERDDDGGLTSSGTVFFFTRTGGTWSELGKVNASDAVANDQLGGSVAVDGNYAISGARLNDDGGLTDRGSVYLFAVNPAPDCNGGGVQDECELRANPGLDTNTNGTIDSCECGAGRPPCDDQLACTTDTCDGQTSRCVFTPNAGFCVIGSPAQCITAGTINPTNECQVCTPATATQAWSAVANDTPCTADTNTCTHDVCTSGACTHPFKTAGDACDLGPGAAGDPDCDDPDTCDGAGVCKPNYKPNQTVCTDDDLFCTGAERCNANGRCLHSGNPCAGQQVTKTCDEAIDMCVVCILDGDCPTDSNPCTDHRCISGQCQTPFTAANAPCGDATDSDCTDPDTCDGAGVCRPNHVANGTPCTDDGLFCNGVEVCTNGACAPTGTNPCAATPQTPNCVEATDSCVFCQSAAECDDTNACTDDACTAGLCTHAPVAAGLPCGSQTAEPCSDPDSCDAAGSCRVNHKPNGTACTDDGQFCTGAETCSSGVCQSGGNPCAQGQACNEAADKCDCTQNAQCDDGAFCNGAETCTGGSCAAGTPPCSGQTPKCLEAEDRCVACVADADCNDNQFCTGTETCVGNACQASGNPCTAQGRVCVEANDRCDCDGDNDCDDGKFCNGAEKCNSGQCAAGTSPCPANATCDERDNRCLTCLTGAECDDDNPCTVDSCPGGTCTHTPLPNCPDADRDGVTDDDDDCPATTTGAEVNAAGCADFQRDTDGDGVTDDADECSRSPAGETVDVLGCGNSQRDDDADGVLNPDDICAATPAGEAVDPETGCSPAQRDDDGDGVLNRVDSCPDTAEGDSVDADGCADIQLDADQDGVLNNFDLCPGTAEGTEIDAGGCPVVVGPADDGTDDEPPPTRPEDETDGGSTPGTGSGAARTCGLFGMITWVFLGLGLAGLRRSTRRR